MAGNATHDRSVFIVDFALDQTMTERSVIFRGRDCWFLVGWRVKAGIGKVELGKDLTPAELVQRLAEKLFQRFAQQNEADITVFGAGTGICGERHFNGLLEQLVLIMGGLEKLDVGGQARGMGQKHTERYLAARVFLFRAACGESGQQIDQWLIELQQAAIIQNHAGRGGGKNLADRSQIVDRFSCYSRGRRFISEMPESLVRDQLSLMSDGDGYARESALVDAGSQDAKGTLELFVLMRERLGQHAVGTLVQKIPSCCFCFRFITHSVHR